MVLMKSSCSNRDMVSSIVRSYFGYIRGSNLTYDEIAELLRYSMCVALDLNSKGFNTRIEESGKECSKYIRNIVQDFDILDKSEDYRQGLLEACVHSMQMSVNRARGGV